MTPQHQVPAIEYVEARRVLLDALEALGSQRSALVLAGAQAVYLRTGSDSLAIAEHTTDGDLAVDPGQLIDAPPLGELMEAAGFRLTELQSVPEPGIWAKSVSIQGKSVAVPVDLIVPAGVAPAGGTRGARLGPHGKRAARKTRGLEAALVDNDSMLVSSLSTDDDRQAQVRVAGVAALLVAKAHKIAERVETDRRDRLNDKDASDVVRLMRRSDPEVVGRRLTELTGDPIAGESTSVGTEHFDRLFGNRAGVGIEMAARALRGVMPEERVRTICLAYAQGAREAPGAS